MLLSVCACTFVTCILIKINQSIKQQVYTAFGIARNSKLYEVPVSEMTYTVSSGTLNPSIPYHTCTKYYTKYKHKCQPRQQTSIAGPYPEKNFGGGFGNEAPQATRPRRRTRRGGGEWGGGVPLPSRLGGLGSVVSSPSGVRKMDLVHSTAARKPLVAIILNILKCMFFTRKLNN